MQGLRDMRDLRRVVGTWMPAGLKRLVRVPLDQFWRDRPVSLDYGSDRGQPVDRHYIEGFLAAHADAVRGHVLEVKDDTYTRRFGRDVTASTVLDVDRANPRATLHADLNLPGALPAAAYDCIILTQTLQYVFELRQALATLAASLKPGGTLLATLPGLTRIAYADMGETWFWSFTQPVARRLVAEALPDADVRVASHGNLAAATAFLHGLAAHELAPDVLGRTDLDYPVILTVYAHRPVRSPPP